MPGSPVFFCPYLSSSPFSACQLEWFSQNTNLNKSPLLESSSAWKLRAHESHFTKNIRINIRSHVVLNNCEYFRQEHAWVSGNRWDKVDYVLTLYWVLRPFRGPRAMEDEWEWGSFYPPLPLRTHKEDTIYAAGIMSSADPRPAGHLLLAFLSYQSFEKDFFCLQAVKPVWYYITKAWIDKAN